MNRFRTRLDAFSYYPAKSPCSRRLLKTILRPFQHFRVQIFTWASGKPSPSASPYSLEKGAMTASLPIMCKNGFKAAKTGGYAEGKARGTALVCRAFKPL